MIFNGRGQKLVKRARNKRATSKTKIADPHKVQSLLRDLSADRGTSYG